MPVVSVIIPTYNHRGYVLETLSSVAAQTFDDYEVIVVNDGSPDDTAELLRPLVAAGRIRYIEQVNRGQAAARDRGLAAATGEYIAFLDDDDLWPPDKLEWQVAALRSQPAAVACYGYGCTFGAPHRLARYPVGEGPSGWALVRFLHETWLLSPGQALMRTMAVRGVGGVDPDVWGADDWDLYLKLARVGPFVYEDRLALRYRVHATNASRRVWRHFRNASWVRRRHLAVARGLGLDLSGIPSSDYMAANFRSLAREMGERCRASGSTLGHWRWRAVELAIDPHTAVREWGQRLAGATKAAASGCARAAMRQQKPR